MAAKIPEGLDPELAKKALEGGKSWGANDQKRYDKLKAESGSSSTTSTTTSEGGNNKGLYGGIMDDFFNSTPGADDPEGRSIKMAFQGNLAQSVLDGKLAKDLGQFNAGIAQQNMTHQADLEQRNQSALMKDEFSYGMESMGAQFKLGEQGAQNQHERDLGMLSATGEEQRLNIGAQGTQDRLTRIVDGEQNRQTRITDGEQNRLTRVTDGQQTRLTDAQNNASKERIQSGVNDTNKYVQDSASEAQRNVATTQKESALGTATINKESALGTAGIQKDAATETTGMRTQADIDIAAIEKDSAIGTAGIAAGASKYGADRSVDVAKVGAQGTIDNTRATGDETRKTMGTENQLKAKDRADMHRYARNTARAM